jgi:hypothetical protein
MKQWICGFAVLGFSASMLAGCVGAEPELTGEEPGFVYSTAVEVDAQGELHVVAVERISAAEMQRQIDERLALAAGLGAPETGAVRSSAEALTVDSACGNNSLWLYDQPFNHDTNTGHRLCVKGPHAGGDFGGDYGAICRGLEMLNPRRCIGGTWAANVMSYWPGADSGYFHSASGLYWHFTAGSTHFNTSPGTAPQVGSEVYWE